jgi:flagellar hook protein FlgE
LVLKAKKSIYVVKGTGDPSYGLAEEFSIGGLKAEGTSSEYNCALFEINNIDSKDIKEYKELAVLDDEGKIIGIKKSTGKDTYGPLQIVSDEGQIYNDDGSLDTDGPINVNELKSKIEHGNLKAKAKNLKPLRIPNVIVEKIPSYDTEVASDGKVSIKSSFKYKKTRVTSFSIEKNGVIKGVLEDGRVAALGQIATSSFKNPAGLSKMGRNLYQVSSNAGEAVLRTGVGADHDQDNSAGYGDMLQGMLEMSNIDLAEQFTDMIVTSRAFQASSKMITTGDEILQDIINLKR